MSIEIRMALPSDFILISELGSKTFYDTWRPVNTEEDMQKYIKDAFNPLKIKMDIEASGINTFMLAFFGKDAIGYVKLRCDRFYEEFKNEKALELERIYVVKEWQDKKAGKALMDQSLQFAKDNNYLWIWLGVNVDNIKAIDFYKRYDFTVFGEKSFKLGEAVDTDFLMKKKLVDSLINSTI